MFADRVDAGRQLAALLLPLHALSPVVVGLPRGGVPVAAEVAMALAAPLDVIIVRKLGAPHQAEFAIGALGEDGVRVLNHAMVQALHVSARQLERIEQREAAEIRRRAMLLRGTGPRVPLTGRTVIVVDDGIATGSTALAACTVARAHGAGRIVLATPVAPSDWVERMGSAADDYVCLATPEPFHAVGEFYRDFTQTTDEEVVACLARSR